MLKAVLDECDVAGARRKLLASEFDRPKNDDRLRTLCKLTVSAEWSVDMPTGGEVGEVHDGSVGLVGAYCPVSGCLKFERLF